MDTTQTTHLSLCSGYGGIDIGLRRVIPSLRTVAYAEIEAFACENLLARMEGGQLDAAPIWSDLKSFPWTEFSGLVDILSGGYPCQPFSAAGKRLGTEDERHLWPFIASGIRLLRPRVCFFENVEGHITLGLSSVISDLEELGYTVSWGIFSAAEVGAPHQRKRVFILAHLCGEGLQGDISRLLVSSRWQKPSGSTGSCSRSSGSGELADSDCAGSGQDWKSGQPRASGIEQSPRIKGQRDSGEVREKQAWPARPGQHQHAWEPPRVVANPASQRANSGQQLGGEECGQGRALPFEFDNSGEVVGNAESGARFGRASRDAGHPAQPNQDAGDRQTEPALGRSITRTSDRLDYAELCVSSDNRTDELRLLGNGVVPATAERAFRTLWTQLTQT